jgi:nucleotide-binding universal stress UspA family protein
MGAKAYSARSMRLARAGQTSDSQSEVASLPLPCFKNVLMGTDFSPASQVALMEAVHLCQASKAKLILLHVVEPGLFAHRPVRRQDDAADLARQTKKQLDELLATVLREGVAAEPLLLEGRAAVRILDTIAQQEIDLAVLGTQGFRGLERLVFGSTAEEVLRSASCPVITVGCRVAAHPTQEGCGPVVFATDFMEPATHALQNAAEIANLEDVPVHSLHVLPLSMEGDSQQAVIAQIMTEALEHLVEKEPIFRRKPICAVTYGSEVSHAIVDYAKSKDAALIVLGVRHKSRLATRLPAQVMYRIIVTAPCPVLTVSYQEFWASSLSSACI